MAQQMRVILDMSKLQEIEREMPGKVGQVMQKLAQDMEGDVKMSFSPESPSAVGNPPGVDTGNLKNSIIAKPHDNGWAVQDGTEYGVMLEYGTSQMGKTRMGPRPFMLPAFERTLQRAPGQIREAMQF